MAKRTVDRSYQQQLGAGARNPSGESTTATIAVLFRDLLRSHAELRSALRGAGRWIMGRAATQRDRQKLEKLRNVLVRADAVAASRDSYDTKTVRDAALKPKDQKRRKRHGASSTDQDAKVVVMRGGRQFH